MKHIGDRMIASALLVWTFPLMVIVALAIKLDSPGPIFCRHVRIGRDGRRIAVGKFRTTRTLHEASPSGQRRQTTRVGGFLRYTRIDDLPQLINVLRGEMTIIGTRQGRPDLLN